MRHSLLCLLLGRDGFVLSRLSRSHRTASVGVEAVVLVVEIEWCDSLAVQATVLPGNAGNSGM